MNKINLKELKVVFAGCERDCEPFIQKKTYERFFAKILKNKILNV